MRSTCNLNRDSRENSLNPFALAFAHVRSTKVVIEFANSWINKRTTTSRAENRNARPKIDNENFGLLKPCRARAASAFRRGNSSSPDNSSINMLISRGNFSAWLLPLYENKFLGARA